MINARNFPLVLCYLFFPIVGYLVELSGGVLFRNWIDVIWFLVTSLALLLSIWGAFKSAWRFELVFLLLLTLAMLAWISVAFLLGKTPLIILMMEVKPLIYIVASVFIYLTWGVPDSEDFAKYGSYLAMIILLELIIRSVLLGELARPVGSGEVNYDAALMCLSLMFSLTDKGLAIRYALPIFIGIIASFSRTALLAAAIVLMWSSIIPFRLRFCAAVIACCAIFSSFLIRDLDVTSLESMDRYLMWDAALQFIKENFVAQTLNTYPGSKIDLSIPPGLLDFWDDQQYAIGVEGIYAYNFHGMWLRIALTWGWGILILILFSLVVFALSSHRPFRVSYLLLIAVLGGTMGVFYLGNVSVPFILALFFLHEGSGKNNSQ